ncbi:MAG: folate-binding protein [Rhizobiales bacterium]|nr:folate-binding protein [Hyphomicrobiales bacterium]
MQAALLPDRGVVKVTGNGARAWLGNLVTIDMGRVAPGAPRFGALLTPQGKIIADFIVAEAEAAESGDFFLDCPRALAPELTDRLNRYKLRAKVMVEDISEVLGVMAVWGGTPTAHLGLTYPDPRLSALGMRCMLAPPRAEEAAKTFGATLADASAYEAHRIALGVPRGGLDFIYGDAFPHETDMDQLGGVDFDKGCYIGQEVVSRVEHRSTARSRVVPIAYDDYAPDAGTPVMAGEKQVGTLGSTAQGRGLALLRLDRAADALAQSVPLEAGGIPIRPVKPDWARFAWPGD